MTPAIENIGLWKRSLGQGGLDENHETAKQELRAELKKCRDRCAILAAQIGRSFPQLTVHDISHLDALWETADVIAGDGYPLNPLEGFVFGVAVLLHDAAQCFEAFESGLSGVRATIEWQDALAAERDRYPQQGVSELATAADFTAVRLLHAKQAKELALKGWRVPGTGDLIYLIDNPELRKRFGAVVGEIAESHNWRIETLETQLRPQINAPGFLPSDWRIDPIKIACLLRCADAAHIDDRRAPDFLYALLRRVGLSADHWKAQNWLARIDIDTSDTSGQSALITSTHAFGPDDADAWWVAYDTVGVLDSELRASRSLLLSRAQCSISPPFKIHSVTGSKSPTEMAKHIQTCGWKPTHAKIHISNVEHLVRTLGGENLYGKSPHQFFVTLRELIQNARDAVVARRAIQDDYEGQVVVRLHPGDTGECILEVEDDGIGMSERVLTGPLLDFGTSFWASDLVREVFPGLRASGFKSVGHFGIGFYSIFMTARRAEVLSHQWDAALQSTCRLSFPKGLTLRPILTVGSQPDLRPAASTVVRLWIDGDIKNFAERKLKASIMGAEEFTVPLSRCISAIAVGLDVEVKFQSGEGPLNTVHKAIQSIHDAQTTLSWLSDISFCDLQAASAVSAYVAKHAERLRKVMDGNKCVGLAALSYSRNDGSFMCYRTVGGLTSDMNGHDEGFIGFLDVAPGSARREISNNFVSSDGLKAWGAEQVQILRRSGLTDLDWYFAASNMVGLGLDPLEILRVPFLIGGQMVVLSVPQIIAHLRQNSIAIYKSSFMDHMESFGSPGQFGQYMTHRALANSSLNDLTLSSGLPEMEFSLLGCLHRVVVQTNEHLKFQIIPKVASGVFGPLDVILVSL